MPSFLSCVAGAHAEVGRLQRKPSLWLVSIPLFTASSAYLTAIGALADFLEDGFGPRDQVRGRDDLVDEANAPGLLRADRSAGQKS